MSAVHLYAELEADAGHADAVAALLAAYGPQVAAEAGNIRFDAYRLADDRARFFVYEQYADDAAFASHLATAHCAAFNAAIAPLVVGGGSRLTRLERVRS